MNAPPASQGTMVFERIFPHPPEKVWRALTEGPLLTQWLMTNDFQPVVGHHFTFQVAAQTPWGGVFHGVVLTAHPCTRLAYTWNVAPDEGGLRTTVTWTLTAKPGGTHLRLEQTGFRAQDHANRQGASQAWPRFLQQLEPLLHTFT